MSKFHYFIIGSLIIALIYTGLSLYFNAFFIEIILGFILFVFVVIGIGVTKIELNFFLKSWTKNPLKQQIAITFDDGPCSENTSKILDTLKRNKVKATFFCIGERVEVYTSVLKRIDQEGHEIGNHTWSHSPFFDLYSTTKVRAELSKTADLLHNITGKEHHLFRPPYGVTNPHIGNAINSLNLQSVGWSVRSFDTVAKNKETLLKKITSKIKAGDILLLHDTKKVTVEALEELIISIKEKGLEMVTVSELFDKTNL